MNSQHRYIYITIQVEFLYICSLVHSWENGISQYEYVCVYDSLKIDLVRIFNTRHDVHQSHDVHQNCVVNDGDGDGPQQRGHIPFLYNVLPYECEQEYGVQFQPVVDESRELSLK